MSQLGTGNFAKHDERFPYKYRAKVLQNTDPQFLGRIKAQVYPMFNDITDPELIPWAVPEFPIGSGAGSGFGVFSVPEVGSWVWVFFEMGDIYQPVYGGSAPTGKSGLPEDRTTDYPFRRIYRTKNGIQITINDYKEGATDHISFRVDHPSGAVIEMKPDGSIILKTDKNDIVLIPDGKALIQADKTLCTGNLTVGSGASGEFTTADAQVVSVAAGIITSIE